MKKLILIMTFLFCSFSIQSADNSEAIKFGKKSLPRKLHRILRPGISKNIVRSRLGRPSSKTETVDSYKIQSKLENLQITYSSDNKLQSLSFQYVGAVERKSRLKYESAIKSLSHLTPILTESGDEKRISVTSIGISAIFNKETDKLIKIDLTKL